MLVLGEGHLKVELYPEVQQRAIGRYIAPCEVEVKGKIVRSRCLRGSEDEKAELVWKR